MPLDTIALLIEVGLGIVPEHNIYEGFLKVDIPERIEPKTFEHVHLLESMAVILKSIQGSYGKF